MENDQSEIVNNQKRLNCSVDFKLNDVDQLISKQFKMSDINSETNQEQNDHQTIDLLSTEKLIDNCDQTDHIMNDLDENKDVNNDLNDEDNKSEDNKSDDNKSEDNKSDDNKSEDNKSEDNKSEDNKSDDNSEDKCDEFSVDDDKSTKSEKPANDQSSIKVEDENSSMNCTDKQPNDQETRVKLSICPSDEQDLNNKKDSIHDQTNKLDYDDIEGSGFPKCFDGWVIRGKAMMVNKRTLNDLEIDGNDAILDCVSQVAPILLKKPNIFPSRYENNNRQEESIEKEVDLKKSDSKELDKEETDEKDQNDQNEEKDSGLKEEQSNKDKKLKDTKVNEQTMLMIPDYFNSSVGNFLMQIGLSRCKEALHKDAMRQTQRLIRKEGEKAEYSEELEKQTKLYNECKGANSIFNFEQIRCNQCDFKTESETVMEAHYLTPHISNRKEYKCNYCVFVTRDQRTIIYHFNAEHKKHCTPEFPPVLYECPTCNYESNQKSKAANHMAKCVKAFTDDVQAELTNQKTDVKEDEYPAITPRPISQDDLKLYDSTMQAIKPVAMNPNMQLPILPGLPRALQKQMLMLLQAQFSQQKLKLNKAMATKLTNQHNNNLRQQFNQQQNNLMSNLLLNNVNPTALAATLSGSSLLNNLNNLNNLSSLSNLNNINPINLNSFAKTAPQLYNMLQSGSQFNSNKNRLPVNQNQLTTQKPNIKGLLQNNNKASSSNDSAGVLNKAGTFVICEICDGYMRDLEILRAHMQLKHKVKIHPKMLASRPPLNCQKCQWRFFTDQGLERHLLGAHGLVTSNMQDLVDQDQDGGRCTICGKVFGNKMVAHMSQVHKITLRPAHLSYKCTVCSSTFNLYRLFENHVYMVHSGQKRSNDNESGSMNKKQKTIDLRINGI